MNIEQYRAIKAQEAKASQTPDQTPIAEKQEEIKPVETKPVEDEKNTTQPAETKPAIPEKITIDGVGEVTFDELKNGYLRTADYTRKTQEVSRKSKEVEDAIVLFEHLKQNPQLAQKLMGENTPTQLDPTTSKVAELENKLFDMMLEREIETLQNKYPDFEVREVLEVAEAKKINNLEDAYFLTKKNKVATEKPDLEKIKQELKEQLIKELEEERKSTSSIISSNDSGVPQTDNTPKLSTAESKVAKNMKMSDAEYVKWRDAGKQKK